MSTNIYGDIVLFYFGVNGIHLVNSGHDMLLMRLKAPNDNVGQSATRLISLPFSSSTCFYSTISCLSKGVFSINRDRNTLK